MAGGADYFQPVVASSCCSLVSVIFCRSSCFGCIPDLRMMHKQHVVEPIELISSATFHFGSWSLDVRDYHV
jgi:hypothetical protein